MKQLYKLTAVIILLVFTFFTAAAQSSFFSPVSENAISNSSGIRKIVPEKIKTFTANTAALKSFLWSLPDEKNLANRRTAPVLLLPMPDGSMAKFNVWKSSVMEPGLQAKYPEIQTFLGQGIDDPYATVRFDYNPYFGFSAQILSAAKGTSYIEAYKNGNIENYQSFYKSDYKKTQQFVCEIPDAPTPAATSVVAAGPCRGSQLYTYRLALACTGEYAVAVCSPSAPTVPATLAKMVVSVNRVTGVYETEVAVRMTLIANTDLLIFLDGTTDPYTNNNGSTMLSQNINNCNTVIGSANFDIGHVFSTGGGGVAFLGCVCTGNKAGGVTGSSNPVGDPFDIDYVAHEMGHQFGGSHTFNSTTGSCSGNRTASAAYEVGSGTSIQAYAGICGTDNTQPNSDPFFHTYSFDQISNFVEAAGATCRTVTSTGNNLPQITAMNNNGVNIPISTPFTLTGTAIDPDGDPLTYCWEEWDLGPATAWNGGNANTTSPLFKSRVPKTNGSRTFPDMAVILANYPAAPAATMGGLKGEILPTQARALKFRLTVRDNKAGGGGVVTGGDGCQAGFTGFFQINTIATPGAFAVAAPNGGESWNAGSTQTVTWNVVNTDQAPISCANVRILLSTDGGLTYPTVVIASTPNDGSEAVTIPGPATTTARIKVEAVGNIFFDISNANFTIAAPPTGFELTTPAATSVTCGTVTTAAITLNTISNGGYTTPVNLTASNVPAGTTVSYSANPVTPGNNTVVTLNNINTLSAGTYNIIINGVSGALSQNVTLTYTVSPGAAPAITAQPGAQTVCAGTGAAFSVTATGALTYQWQESINGGTTWNNIGGATATTYSIAATTGTQNNYQYRCIITGQCNTATSNAVILTVNTPPAVTAQPTASTICSGANTSFTVGASGTGVTYQWQVSTTGCAGTYTNLTNTAPYSGVTSATLTITGATAALNSYNYRCVVNGTCPGSATSNCAALTVNTPVSLTAQPANAVVCAGTNAVFSVTATGTTPTYQWQESTNGGTTFTNINNGGVYGGATTATLTLTGVTAVMSTYQYRCVVTGASPCTALNSASGVLTVNTAPAVTAQPAAATICTGSNTSYSVNANGTAITYQWQVSTDGGTTFANVANAAPYTGVTTATLNITGATAAMNDYRYRCVVNGTCTPAATTNNAPLTVISPVAITTQPAANTAICSTGNTTFTVAGSSTVSIIYQWQVSTDGGTTWNNIANAAPYSGTTSATLTITNVPTTLNGYRYRALLSNATCTAPTVSGVSALTVNVLPTATIAATATSLQAGQSSVITATTTPTTGLNIAWYRNGVLIAGATSNTYTVNVNNLGAYRVVVTDQATGTCVNQSNDVVITAAASDRLFIFPSPTDGQFTVSYYNATAGSTKQGITIYDSWGRRVYDNVFAVNQAYQLHAIDFRRYSSGVYYVVLRDSNGKKVKTGEVLIR